MGKLDVFLRLSFLHHHHVDDQQGSLQHPLIEAFYQAAQDRDYQLAKELLDANGRHQVSVIGDAAWQALVDELSGNQTINEMYYGSTRNYGSNAVVGIINYHSDESANPRVEELVRESGHWRIMWEPGTRTFVKTVQNYEPWFGK